MIPIAQTDLHSQLVVSEVFAKQCLGVEINLLERFVIPETLPWSSAIPVFDPGDFTNRKAVELLKKLELSVLEEVDVMQYSGSGASVEPTLHFIQNSVRPDEDTVRMSPNQLAATGKNWLSLRGYALAFGLHHFITQKYLDQRTFTCFPNARLSSGKIACGNWGSDSRKIRFGWGNPGYIYPFGGARQTISCPLR